MKNKTLRSKIAGKLRTLRMLCLKAFSDVNLYATIAILACTAIIYPITSIWLTYCLYNAFNSHLNEYRLSFKDIASLSSTPLIHVFARDIGILLHHYLIPSNVSVFFTPMVTTVSQFTIFSIFSTLRANMIWGLSTSTLPVIAPILLLVSYYAVHRLQDIWTSNKRTQASVIVNKYYSSLYFTATLLYLATASVNAYLLPYLFLIIFPIVIFTARKVQLPKVYTELTKLIFVNTVITIASSASTAWSIFSISTGILLVVSFIATPFIMIDHMDKNNIPHLAAPAIIGFMVLYTSLIACLVFNNDPLSFVTLASTTASLTTLAGIMTLLSPLIIGYWAFKRAGSDIRYVKSGDYFDHEIGDYRHSPKRQRYADLLRHLATYGSSYYACYDFIINLHFTRGITAALAPLLSTSKYTQVEHLAHSSFIERIHNGRSHPHLFDYYAPPSYYRNRRDTNLLIEQHTDGQLNGSEERRSLPALQSGEIAPKILDPLVHIFAEGVIISGGRYRSGDPLSLNQAQLESFSTNHPIPFSFAEFPNNPEVVVYLLQQYYELPYDYSETVATRRLPDFADYQYEHPQIYLHHRWPRLLLLQEEAIVAGIIKPQSVHPPESPQGYMVYHVTKHEPQYIPQIERLQHALRDRPVLSQVTRAFRDKLYKETNIKEELRRIFYFALCMHRAEKVMNNEFILDLSKRLVRGMLDKAYEKLYRSREADIKLLSLYNPFETYCSELEIHGLASYEDTAPSEAFKNGLTRCLTLGNVVISIRDKAIIATKKESWLGQLSDEEQAECDKMSPEDYTNYFMRRMKKSEDRNAYLGFYYNPEYKDKTIGEYIAEPEVEEPASIAPLVVRT